MKNNKKQITKDEAIKLCDQIRNERKGKWCSIALMQCWGCYKFSGGDYNKMCLKSESGYDGCNLINKRYS